LDQRDVFLRILRAKRVEDALRDFAPVIVGQLVVDVPAGLATDALSQYRCSILEHT
jgi:hypothetical protein